VRLRGVLSVGLATTLIGATCAAAATRSGTQCASPDWRSFGAGVAHSFSVGAGCSAIDTTSVHTLVPAWVIHTPDSISASPAIVNGTAYVGSWDGTFYAVDIATGKARWTFQIRTHTAMAFGRIVSTATVEKFADPTAPGGRRLVVLFGGGSAVWALDAETGKELAFLDVDPRTPATIRATHGSAQTVEVESSPLVVDVRVGRHTERRIYAGMDVHNDKGVGQTGVVAMALSANRSGRWRMTPVWKFDPETGKVYRGRAGLTVGSGQGFGCAGVWSSPALDAPDNLVVFGSASCSYPEAAKAAGENWSEQMWAVHADTGRLAWSFRPDKTTADAHLDDDFGASPNVYVTAGGKRVVGEGRKDACYYARSAANGAALWHTCAGTAGNLTNDFGIGGFLGTPAVQTDAHGRAERVIGATAIPIPHNASEAVNATTLVRAMDPATGKVLWTYRLGGPSYASTAVAGGVALVPDTFTSSLIALDASTGLPLATLPLVGPPSSAPAVVGNSVYVTTGTRETDLEYKAFGLKVQQLETVGGASPLSPLSGIYRLSLPGLPG
jgi:polyvinyl alcohol dehydrogenase (cytochrome)